MKGRDVHVSTHDVLCEAKKNLEDKRREGRVEIHSFLLTTIFLAWRSLLRMIGTIFSCAIVSCVNRLIASCKLSGSDG